MPSYQNFMSAFCSAELMAYAAAPAAAPVTAAGTANEVAGAPVVASKSAAKAIPTIAARPLASSALRKLRRRSAAAGDSSPAPAQYLTLFGPLVPSYEPGRTARRGRGDR